jgi:hypothetical protein
MSDEDAGSRDSRRTMHYSREGTPASRHADPPASHDDVHKPWFETRQGAAKFRQAQDMLRKMIYFPIGRAFRGWDRIRKRQVPERRCRCCQQVLLNQPMQPFLLTEHEYRIVDTTLARAYTEFQAAAHNTTTSERHMVNTYHILDGQSELFERGLLVGLQANLANFLALIRDLLGQSVPDRDVQTF